MNKGIIDGVVIQPSVIKQFGGNSNTTFVIKNTKTVEKKDGTKARIIQEFECKKFGEYMVNVGEYVQLEYELGSYKSKSGYNNTNINVTRIEHPEPPEQLQDSQEHIKF